jgi:hypothetical protein
MTEYDEGARPIDAVEDNPAAQRALEWYFAQPEPRDPSGLVDHLRLQFVTLFSEAVRELPAHVPAEDIAATFAFERISGDQGPTFLDAVPGDLTERERARWDAIARERRDIVDAVTAVRAEIAYVATEVALDDEDDDDR